MGRVKKKPESRPAQRTKLFVINVRKALGISQEAFGKIIGKERDVINKYEKGTIVPSGDTILKILEEVLGSDISALWL
jgi:transcriptional regulator with XRE-family HTH domain